MRRARVGAPSFPSASPLARSGELSDESRAAFETVLPDAGKRVWFRLLIGADERKLPQLRRGAGDRLLPAMLGG